MITRSARPVPGTVSSSITMAVVLCSAIVSSLLCLACAQSDNCGASLTPIVTGGGPISQGQYPWLAVLYQLDEAEKWNQVCTGALISNRFVLTSAHCVEREVTKPGNIRVGLGKIHSEFYHNEDHATIANVSEIVVPGRYLGSLTNYAMDVGLLRLSTAVELSDYILPACVNLDKTTRISNGATVHAAGWSRSDNKTMNGAAVAAVLTFLDHQECVTRVNAAYRRFITHDKICSLSTNGTHEIDRGDGGGALTFIKNARHFVVGIVSVKIIGQTAFMTYTDLSAPEIRLWLKEELEKSH